MRREVTSSPVCSRMAALPIASLLRAKRDEMRQDDDDAEEDSEVEARVAPLATVFGDEQASDGKRHEQDDDGVLRIDAGGGPEAEADPVAPPIGLGGAYEVIGDRQPRPAAAACRRRCA